ncbi:MerR family transcriptional regulator [Geobacillus zalihae]|uniref:MerR family transcriptional regulator n=1 Tax=Geobacillus zalihae TaxID=213419 RepID=UPI001F609F29|nr:MerR family transcriptional regulator [Geobacillus zalihae]
MELKTSDVAGHYLFDEKTVALLERVKFEQGAAMEAPPEATPEAPPASSRSSTTPPNVPIHALFQEYIEPEMDRVSSRLDELEQQLEQKADDVVSIQLLHHRQEMEEIAARLAVLEQTVARLEQQLNTRPPSPHEPPKEAKRKRRGFRRVMGLFA